MESLECWNRTETNTKDEMQMHIAMYPWFAMGHLTPFLDLANKLAHLGHKISFFSPPRTQLKLATHNHHPDLITFFPIPIPPVDGLPSHAETTHDIHPSARPILLHAMDLTRPTIDSLLATLKSNIMLFDSLDWLPALARHHGARSIYYAVQSPSMFAYCSLQARGLPSDHPLGWSDFVDPPPGFPSPNVRLHVSESNALVKIFMGELWDGRRFLEKHEIAVQQSEGLLFKACREMDEIYCDFVEKNYYGKPVFLAGPAIPEHPSGQLDQFSNWLGKFSPGSVIYCACGSECVLPKAQFDELVIGLGLTGRPFLAILKPPHGYDTIESALPEGFLEATKGRGMVYDGWVQQPLILSHDSVGCFVTHCGPGSLAEAMVSGGCQLVLMPQAVDQFINARILSLELGVGVEAEKREIDGVVDREAVRKAVELVMEDGKVGNDIRVNYAKLRDSLLKEGLEESYLTSLVQKMKA